MYYYNGSIMGVDMAMGEAPKPKHKCLAEDCKPSQKDFYKGVLDYHKLTNHGFQLHDCGNVMCMIEQIKN